MSDGKLCFSENERGKVWNTSDHHDSEWQVIITIVNGK